jgi:hypothetical protein
MSIEQELFKEFIGLISAMIILGLGWLIGQRIATYWALQQKRRELKIKTANEFYALYGEFFAVWKLWAYSRRQDFGLPDACRYELLDRATKAEGSLEAIFVKISAERNLSDEETEIMGRFRQGYQTLRESIRDKTDTGWYHQNHPEYASFKRLAYFVALIIDSEDSAKIRYKEERADSLMRITASTWEANWVLTKEEWQRMKESSNLADD